MSRSWIIIALFLVISNRYCFNLTHTHTHTLTTHTHLHTQTQTRTRTVPFSHTNTHQRIPTNTNQKINFWISISLASLKNHILKHFWYRLVSLEKKLDILTFSKYIWEQENTIFDFDAIDVVVTSYIYVRVYIYQHRGMFIYIYICSYVCICM